MSEDRQISNSEKKTRVANRYALPKVPQKALTKEQQERALALRKEGKSIKRIAKELHIHDKRVAYFIRPIEEKANVHKHNKKLFKEFLKYSFKETDKSCRTFVAQINENLLSLLEGQLLGKGGSKERKQEVQEMLTNLLTSYVGAAMEVAALSFWTMPAKYKKLWLYMAGEEPEWPYEV